MKNTVLPHGLQVLCDAAGVDAALKIALERGGSRFRIPQKAAGSVLEDIVGIDAAVRIVNDLADERIDIPLAKTILSDWLRGQGWSQERRAMALKISRRTVQYWDSPQGAPSRQDDLFSPSE